MSQPSLWTIRDERFAARLDAIELNGGTTLAVVPVLAVLLDLEVKSFALRLNFVARFRAADPGWMERIQFVVEMIELLHQLVFDCTGCGQGRLHSSIIRCARRW